MCITKNIYIQGNPYETMVALVEDGHLAEIAVERKGNERVVGNVYKGCVKNVLPGMQAAFVDIGLDRNAFLYAGDITPEDEDFRFNGEDMQEQQVPDIRSLVKVGQAIMVQVIKEPFAAKGARITTNITLPGRSIVLMPMGNHVGVSRRIDEQMRSDVREMMERIRPEGMGLIARTISITMDQEELQEEIDRQVALYCHIQALYAQKKGPGLVHSEGNLVYRAIRDLLMPDVDRVEICGGQTYQDTLRFVRGYGHDLDKRVYLFNKHYDMFEYYGLHSRVDKALARKIWLKSGGYLVIDHAEALTVIDVNTGKYVGRQSLQKTILNTNIEAAEEVARQLRLRDISGIIVVDFIDMEDQENRNHLVDVLKDAVKRDRTRTMISGITDLGIVEMTRKKRKRSLGSVFHAPCPYCGGEGILLSPASMAMRARRAVIKQFEESDCDAVLIKANTAVINEIQSMMQPGAQLIEPRAGRSVYVLAEENMHLEHLEVRALYWDRCTISSDAVLLV